MEKPINPYAPPRSYQTEEPITATIIDQIVSGKNISFALPLIDFVNRQRNERRLMLEFAVYDNDDDFNRFQAITVALNHGGEFNYKEWLEIARQYMDVEETNQEFRAWKHFAYKLKSCDLSNPLLRPAALDETDNINVHFSGELIKNGAVEAMAILEKYQSNDEVFKNTQAALNNIQLYMDAMRAVVDNKPAAFIEKCFRSSTIDSYLKEPHNLLESSIRFFLKSSEGEKVSTDDRKRILLVAHAMVDQYRVGKPHFDKAMHHVLYERAKQGLEQAPERKPSAFFKCTTAIGNTFKKVWPKKMNPQNQLDRD